MLVDLDYRLSPTLVRRDAPSLPLKRRRATLATFLHRLDRWNVQRRGRAALHALDDRALKDIGLTRADIEFAADGGRHRGSRAHDKGTKT